MAFKKQIDPTKVRLSKHFLLSDFMGCNSVYTKGLQNRIYDKDAGKIEEGIHLCESILEPVLEEFGPVTVTYGYISPLLSQQIIKYQDPSKKSFHRWDLGAACDIIPHDVVQDDCPINSSPIMFALEVDDLVDAYARIITYSESPGICVASSTGDNGDNRAFYENVYEGTPKVKPKFLRHQTGKARDKRYNELVAMGFKHPWKGAGYPTHHGGGEPQFHHIRVSHYTMVSDYMYNRDKVSRGEPNEPTADAVEKMEILGHLYDWLIENGDYLRLSIVKAYDRTGHRYTEYIEGLSMDLIPPEGRSLEELKGLVDDYSIAGSAFVFDAEVYADRVRIWADLPTREVEEPKTRRRRSKG
jgi:hypothetical protein